MPKNSSIKSGDEKSALAVNPIVSDCNAKPDAESSKMYKNSSKATFGQCIEPQTVIEPSLASSVADFVHEVIPQGQSVSLSQNELIQWVDVKRCEYVKDNALQVSFVFTLGLARGYQVWWMQENGYCIEVISDRKGPLKCGHLLPFFVECDEDNFKNSRPLFAYVDGNPLQPEGKVCSVSFMSLASGQDIHELTFKNPIIDLASSSKCFVVCLFETLIVCHPGTLTERWRTAIPSSPDPSMCSHFSLSQCFLAYADKTYYKTNQSVGGVVIGDDPSYGGQIMNAAKTLSKTVSSIGETFVTSLTVGGFTKAVSNTHDLGIVTVVDVSPLSQNQAKSDTKPTVISHFVAHESPIGYLEFGHGGQLLLTCAQSSTAFHIFALHPHSAIPALSSVQHLYTLNRGNSAAKVINVTFSEDNRWVAVSTNHGTTHLFTITPYGGPINMRTHGGELVNKESRFERTAGLTSEHITRNINHHAPAKPGQAVFGSSQYYKEHPAIAQSPLYKTTVNPRLNLNAVPVILDSIAKIRARIFSAESLSAWASDNNPITSSKLVSRSGQCAGIESSRRIVAAFNTNFGLSSPTDGPILCILSSDGILTSYQIRVRNERHNSSSSISSMNVNEQLSSSPNVNSAPASNKTRVIEIPIRVKVKPMSQWILHRTRNLASIEAPLGSLNALIMIAKKTFSKASGCDKQSPDYWLQHVEVETYSGPHRRLWMGPQFTFGVFANSSHASAQLFNPNDPQSNNFYATAQKCCPVLIEKNSSFPRIGSDFAIESSSRIVCGSWSSEFDMKTLNDPSVKEKIEDAMREIDPFDLAHNREKSVSSRHSSGTQPDLLSLSGIDL